MTQRGVTYLAVLIWLALLSTGAAIVSENWVVLNRRASERELLFVGNQYRDAIRSYYLRTPGTVKRYPEKLEDLLEDRRHLGKVRHLRRLYRDPLTHDTQWGLVHAPEGGIMGVYSLAQGTPLKQENFRQRDAVFAGASSYAEWRFVYEGPARQGI